MKILVVTQYYWPENFRINDLVDGLVNKGHEVTVLTGKPNYPAGKYFSGYGFIKNNIEHRNGVKIYRVPLVPRGSDNKLLLVINYLSFVFFGLLLGPLYCRSKYDLIFSYSVSPITLVIPARFIGWLRNIPVIIWVQDLWPESLTATGAVSNKSIINVVGKLVKWIYKGCDLVLVQSRRFTDAIAKFNVDTKKIRYFPNTAESLYKPIPYDQGNNITSAIPNGFVVMFAGNIGVAQDFETILKAAVLTRKKQNIHWVILGNGRQFNWVKNEVDRLELNDTVHLLGSYPMNDMPIFFSKADVMLVTLKKEPIFSLTIPGKVQSYMACAKPIISALDGEGGQVIKESGAGLSVDAEDSAGLANAVLTMEKMDKATINKMGQKGLDYYNTNFDRGMLLDKLEIMMNDLVEKGI